MDEMWPYFKMADAGFYVMSPNKPDTVICAFCLLELDGWEPEDNPWSVSLVCFQVKLTPCYCVRN